MMKQYTNCVLKIVKVQTTNVDYMSSVKYLWSAVVYSRLELERLVTLVMFFIQNFNGISIS